MRQRTHRINSSRRNMLRALLEDRPGRERAYAFAA